MSDRKLIPAPFKRVHAVMYLLSILGIGAPAGLVGYALSLSATPQRRADLMIGLGVVAAISFVGLLILWLGDLWYQRTASVTPAEIAFRPWIRFGGLAKDRVIPLAEVEHVLLLRPHHIEFTMPAAETQVGTFWRRLKGIDRIGTFWWRQEDYLALERALNEVGVPAEYRHVVRDCYLADFVLTSPWCTQPRLDDRRGNFRPL